MSPAWDLTKLPNLKHIRGFYKVLSMSLQINLDCFIQYNQFFAAQLQTLHINMTNATKQGMEQIQTLAPLANVTDLRLIFNDTYTSLSDAGFLHFIGLFPGAITASIEWSRSIRFGPNFVYTIICQLPNLRTLKISYQQAKRPTFPFETIPATWKHATLSKLTWSIDPKSIDIAEFKAYLTLHCPMLSMENISIE